jgi:ferredoxin
MTTHRIVIDGALCSGFGTCAELAPELFDVGPDGVASARQGTTGDSGVLDAAGSCPMGAIAIYDAETGEREA